MKKVSKFIVKSRFILIPIFVLLVCLCGYLSTQVSINYNILDYLSADSDSSVATDKLIQEFGSDGMAEVMVVDVSKEEANSIASAILEIDGVESVIFDDSNEYNYSSNNALFTVYLSYSDYDTKSYDVIDDICEMLDDKEIALGGTTIMARFLLEVMEIDMIKIMLIATLVVFAILMLTSSSWVEPFLFLIIIFGAILINAGTNIIFGEISYITNSIAAVLQLALAMDYSIVLLHSYNKQKKLNSDNRVSMSNALAQSFKLISSSGLTTIAGLIALVFMSFSIGFDVGMVLAKGILVSLLSVLIFMPGLLLFFDKLMKKTAHRSIFDRMFKEKAMGEENQPNNQHLDNISPLSSENKYVLKQPVLQTKKSKYGISKEDKKLDKKIKKEIEKYDENNKQKYSRYERFVYKTRVIMPMILVIIFCFGAIANMNLDYYYYIET